MSDEDREYVLGDRRRCLSLSAELTSGADVGAELVRVLGQVVVSKAQQAGWELLVKRLKESGRCEDAEARDLFRNTCELLKTLNIRDLVSSPSALLAAAMSDLLTRARRDPEAQKTLDQLAPFAGALLAGADVVWLQKSTAVSFGIKRQLNELLMAQSAAQCRGETTTAVQQYGVVLGVCMIQVGNLKEIGKCNTVEAFALCRGKNEAGAQRLLDLTVAAAGPTATVTDWVDLAFGIGDQQLQDAGAATAESAEAARRFLSALHDVFAGVTSADWVRAASGGVRLIEEMARALPESERQRQGAKLLGLLAAIGNYALTYDGNKEPDPAAAAAARERIITELVERMVNRTERSSGGVLSLGGNLGLIGGARFGSGGDESGRTAIAFPVQLGLGVGFQTYGSKRGLVGGFHAQLSALDLGQYVNFDGQDLEVDTPKVQSSVVASLAVGLWFNALRETPLYVAVSGSAAPFNQAGGRATYQLGLVAGIYVPLLDFN